MKSFLREKNSFINLSKEKKLDSQYNIFNFLFVFHKFNVNL